MGQRKMDTDQINRNLQVMCYYPQMVLNPRYRANKKNDGNIPQMIDEREKYVPVGCGWCRQCRHQRASSWNIRLREEIKDCQDVLFITLTFSPDSLKQLIKESEETECNEIARYAVRKWLERVRKRTKKSVRHWIVTELGQNNTERIHMHGLLMLNDAEKAVFTKEFIEYTWKYGNVDVERVGKIFDIKYLTKYLFKFDKKHPYYRPKIMCSSGIGKAFLGRNTAQSATYRGADTHDYYLLDNGVKVGMPSYYRSKIYTDEQRIRLWMYRLDKNERWIDGVRIKLRTNADYIYFEQLLRVAQADNERLGYEKRGQQKRLYVVTKKMLEHLKKNVSLQRNSKPKRNENQIRIKRHSSNPKGYHDGSTFIKSIQLRN